MGELRPDRRTLKADFVLTGAGRLVTCAPALGDGILGIIEDGAAAALDGVIGWVGKTDDVRHEVELVPDAIEVDARGSA
ncbi:MAG: hypothetical protein LC663_02020, partial [Actinobacteria bacterium]|nr:hypothetical protein [Actinomycetota bacterium]